MDDKSLNLWRQIELCRRRAKGRAAHPVPRAVQPPIRS